MQLAAVVAFISVNLSLAAASNATEIIDWPSTPTLPSNLPGLDIRDTDLSTPQATVLPQAGIAATIGPNETHYYSLNLTSAKVNISVSLSECVRSPLTENPLTLSSGPFKGTTADGGLLNIRNFTMFNGTLAISSPRTDNLQAHWSYQLGYDDSAVYASDFQGLYWVDSDFANSLFVTSGYDNFSMLIDDTPFAGFVNRSDLNATTRQFQLFLHNVNDTNHPNNSKTSLESNDPLGVWSVLGNSFCAMETTALLNQNNADFSVTNRSSNSSVKVDRGQFLFTGLNRSTYYAMQLGIPPKPGYLGGLIFSPVPFLTKSSDSCQLIYNMSTCPNTAFSVPGNASAFTVNELTDLYDHYVGLYYNNFTQALSQVNCNATREDMFSVFSTCDDCNTAYQSWLCTVAVPRCEDWTNPAPYLKERLPNGSRNQMINEVLRPGKYKEVLPCYWLCDNLATYCPISMGFACPRGLALNESYGWQADDGNVSCSYPGAVYRPDSAGYLGPSWLLFTTGLLLTLLIL